MPKQGDHLSVIHPTFIHVGRLVRDAGHITDTIAVNLVDGDVGPGSKMERCIRDPYRGFPSGFLKILSFSAREARKVP